MEYNVISSGSRGNCVIINNDVMIDAGLPFNKIKSYLYSIKYLIITHIHGDHFKVKTLQRIASNFPRIKMIGNYEIHQIYNMNYIANEGFPIETPDYTFMPFVCVHDVLTYGYTWNVNDNKIIYATDTASLEFAPPDKYDYLFLESNHDEYKLEEARNDHRNGGYDPYASGKRHLSTQQAKAFYYMNRRSAESELIELHKSARFY